MFFTNSNIQFNSFYDDPGVNLNPTSLGETWDASKKEAEARGQLLSSYDNLATVYDEHNKKVKDITGVELGNPTRIMMPGDGRDDERRQFMSDFDQYKTDGGGLNQLDYLRQWRENAYRKQLMELADKHPDKRGDLLPDRSFIEAGYAKRGETEQRVAKTWEKSNQGALDWMAWIGGQAHAGFTDPVNILTMPFGFGGVGTGAKGLAMAFLKNGGFNAGIEVAQQPFIQSNNAQAGDTSGWEAGATAVGGAFLLGGALDTAVRGTARGLRYGLGYEPVVRDGIVVGYRRKAEPGKDGAAPAVAPSPEADKSFIPSETVAKADDGDIKAIREVAERSGMADHPVVRQALDAMDANERLFTRPAEMIPQPVHDSAVTQALRHVSDPDMEPAPVVRLDASPEQVRDLESEVQVLRAEIRQLQQRMADGDPTVKPADAEALTAKLGETEAGFETARRALYGDDLIEAVDGGRIPSDVAEVVATHVENRDIQGKIAAEVMARRPVNATDARGMVAEIVNSPDYRQPDLDAEPVRALDDPYGPDAAKQVQQLEQQMAEELGRKAAPPPTPEDVATRVQEIVDHGAKVRAAIEEVAGVVPDGVEIRVFSSVADLPDTLRASVEMANAAAFADGLRRFQAAGDDVARAAARRMLDDAAAGRGIEGIAQDNTIWIASFAMNPKGRVAHEVVHALKTSGQISPDEVRLLAAHGRDTGAFPEKTERLYRTELEARGWAPERIASALDEEAAAHAIEARVNAGEVPAPVKSVLDRIGEFFERVTNALRRQGFMTAEEMKALDGKPVNDALAAFVSGEMAKRESVKAWMRQEDVTAIAQRVDGAEPTPKAAPETFADPESGSPITSDELNSILDMWRYVQSVKSKKKPMQLSQWVIDTGRVQDQNGELTNILGGKARHLISGKGRTLDDAAEAAWEAGYFGGDRPTVRDFLDAIDDDVRGNKRYRASDEALVEDIAVAEDMRSELDQLGLGNAKTEQDIIQQFRAGQGREGAGGGEAVARGAEGEIEQDLSGLLYAMKDGAESPEQKRIAEAAGFDTSTVWHHGTRAGEFDRFDPGKVLDERAKTQKRYNEDRPRMVFMSEDPVLPQLFSGGDNGTVRKLYVKRDLNLFDGTKDAAKLADFLAQNETAIREVLTTSDIKGLAQSVQEGGWPVLETKPVQEWLRSQGYDGFVAQQRSFSGTGSHRFLGIFDTANDRGAIRDTRAAFDPTKADSPNLMFAFAGERAKTADLDALAKAKELEGTGQDRASIWNATGWFRGVDGKWRFEIDDSNANLRQSTADLVEGKSVPLGSFYRHDDLYAAYPDLTQTRLALTQSYAPTEGAMVRMPDGRAAIVAGYDPKRVSKSDLALMSVVPHEAQHVVQDVERFAQGGNRDVGHSRADVERMAKQAYEANQAKSKLPPTEDDLLLAELGIESPDVSKSWDELTPRQQMGWWEAGRGRAYHHLAGEAEARLVQNRMDLSPEQRRARPPWLDYDVPESQQIVRGASEPQFAMVDRNVGQEMRRDLDQLGYFSGALEAAKRLKQAKGTPEQMLAMLQKEGAKKAEIEATGLGKFLEGRPSVTRDEIVGHLEQNRLGLNESNYLSTAVPAERIALINKMRTAAPGEQAALAQQIHEFDVARGQQMAGAKPAKWSAHSLDPSNPTYRETVLHLPETRVSAIDARLTELNDEINQMSGGMTRDIPRDNMQRFQELRAEAKALSDERADLKRGNFVSGHFPEPNIVGHMMTSMTKHEGKPVYTIDQIQSDWGQKLRDGGVRDEAKIAELQQKINDATGGVPLADVIARGNDRVMAAIDRPNRPPERTRQIVAELRAYAEKRDGTPAGQKALALADTIERVRMLEAELKTAMSATPGHPLVNTTDQWSNTTLRRAIRQAAEADADYIAIPTGDTVLSYNPGDTAGMHGFYGSKDQEGIVPKNLRKILLNLDKDMPKASKIDELETPSGMKGEGFTLFPLTAKVKETVKTEGQPLFAMRSEPEIRQAPDQPDLTPERITQAIQPYLDAYPNIARIMQEGTDTADLSPIITRIMEDIPALTEARAAMTQALGPEAAQAAELAVMRAIVTGESPLDGIDIDGITRQVMDAIGQDDAPAAEPMFAMRGEDGRMKLDAQERAKQLQDELAAIEAQFQASGGDERLKLQAKRAALLGAQAYERLIDETGAFRDAYGRTDRAKAMMAVIENFGQREQVPFVDLVNLKSAIQNDAIGMMDKALWSWRKGAVLGDLRRKFNSSVKANMENVVRSLAGEKVTDQTAIEFGKAWQGVTEYLRQRFNAAGGDIAKLDGWIMPQYHDPEALLKGGREGWVKFIMPLLDRKRIVDASGAQLDDGKLRSMLQDIWTNITTDGAFSRELSDAPGKGVLYKRHLEHRVLHFKDADSWLAYSKKFGGNDIYAAMIGHISMMARDIAMIERLGPNPDLTMRRLRQTINKEAAMAGPALSLFEEFQAKIASLKAEYKALPGGIDDITRKIGEIHGKLDGMRDDAGTGKRARRRIEGKLNELRNQLGPLHEQLEKVLSGEGMTPAQRLKADEINAAAAEMALMEDWRPTSTNPVQRVNRLLTRADEMFKLYNGNTNVPADNRIASTMTGIRNIIGASSLVYAPFSAVTDQATQLAGRLFIGMPVTNQLASFVTGFTKGDRKLALAVGLGLDQVQAAFADQARMVGWYSTRHVTGYIADRTHAYSGLSPMTQAAKLAFGLDFMRWMASLKDTKFDALDDTTQRLLTRHGFKPADWDAIRTATPEIKAGSAMMTRNAIAAAAGRDLAERYMVMLFRERGQAVLEGGLQGRTAAISEAKPGTASGEFLRSAMMLKSFPTTYMMLILGRLANEIQAGRGLSKSTLAYGASIFFVGTMLGAVAKQLKNVGQGRDPEDMTTGKFWAQSFMQSGGAGIFGDFISSATNRTGSGLSSTLAGPVPERIGTLLNIVFGNAVQYARDEKTNAGRELVNLLRQNTPGMLSPWYTRLAYERLILDELQRIADPDAHKSWASKVRGQKKRQGNDFYYPPGGTPRAPNFGAAFGGP